MCIDSQENYFEGDNVHFSLNDVWTFLQGQSRYFLDAPRCIRWDYNEKQALYYLNEEITGHGTDTM